MRYNYSSSEYGNIDLVSIVTVKIGIIEFAISLVVFNAVSAVHNESNNVNYSYVRSPNS